MVQDLSQALFSVYFFVCNSESVSFMHGICNVDSAHGYSALCFVRPYSEEKNDFPDNPENDKGLSISSAFFDYVCIYVACIGGR